VAQALGAREFALARRTGLISLAMGVLVACVVAASIALGAQTLAAIYSIDAQVQAGAAGLLVFVAGYHLFDAVQAITVNVLRAYKRTVVPMLIYGIGLWCVGLAGGYQLGLGHADLGWLGLHPPMGAQGFWAGAIAGMSLAGLAVAVYFFRVTRPEVVRRVEGEAVRAEAHPG
jgi:MATE family multidrug resistance protein